MHTQFNYLTLPVTPFKQLGLNIRGSNKRNNLEGGGAGHSLKDEDTDPLDLQHFDFLNSKKRINIF